MVDAGPTHHWVLYTAQDPGIFKILSEDDEAPKSSSQIAERTKAEPFLIRPLMQQMAAMHTVSEVGADSFAHNKFSRYLLTQSADATLSFMRWFQAVEAKMPEYLAAHNYQSPSDAKMAPFGWVNGMEGMSWFGFLSKNAKYGPLFATMMRAESGGKPTWSDGQLYPVKEKLTSVEYPEGALIVDLGGGNGQDLECFSQESL